MNDIVIDSHVRLPVSKKKQKDDARRRKLFSRFADAYAAANVIRPVRYVVQENGFLRIFDGYDRQVECASEKRIEQVIRMLRDKVRDR